MSKTAKPTHNRVAVFQSSEVQIEAAPGEWVRDKRRSTKPIADIINQFLEQHKASVVFVSPPTIELTSMSSMGTENKTRTYRCAVSVIYSPEEIVHDGTVQELEEEGLDLSNIPEEHRETILKTIQSKIKPDGSKPWPSGNKPTSRKARAKAKSETAIQTGKAGTCVQPRTNKPDNRGGGSVGVSNGNRSRRPSARAGK